MKSSVLGRYAALIALLFTAIVLLFSCSSVISLSYEDDLLVDKKNNVSYTFASVSFEPALIGEKYAEYKKLNVELYTIPGLSPSKWLAEQYEGIGSIFYSTDINLPALAEFEANKVMICITADVSLPLAEITDLQDISAIIEQIDNGERAIIPPTCENSYTLKFVSEKYPFIYYTLRYLDCGDGRYYFHDRGTKKSVHANDIIEKYIQGS